MTAQWEKRLDDIENGMDSYESFLSDLQASVRNWTNQVITAPINPIFRRWERRKNDRLHMPYMR